MCNHACIQIHIYIHICTYSYIDRYTNLCTYGCVRWSSILPCSLQKIRNGPWWKPLRTCLEKKRIFVDSVWEQKRQSRSHRSVSRNTLGAKTLLGWLAMTRTAQGRQIWLAARACTFAVCSLRYHPATSSEFFVYRVAPQIWTFCYRVAPRIWIFGLPCKSPISQMLV